MVPREGRAPPTETSRLTWSAKPETGVTTQSPPPLTSKSQWLYPETPSDVTCPAHPFISTTLPALGPHSSQESSLGLLSIPLIPASPRPTHSYESTAVLLKHRSARVTPRLKVFSDSLLPPQSKSGSRATLRGLRARAGCDHPQPCTQTPNCASVAPRKHRAYGHSPFTSPPSVHP